MLNPVHLRTLVVVVRTGSFADAARRLGYTGSAVSQQIAALERAVKLPLFERDARSVKATAAAEILASRAQSALASLELLMEDVREITQGNLGSVRLGSFPTASQRLLPSALAMFNHDHPQVDVLLDEGEPDELLGLLVDHELDVTLVYHYDLVPQRWPKELRPLTLLDEDLVLLLPIGHRFANRESLQLAELSDETWISTREGTAGASCFVRVCAAADFDPIIDFRSNDYHVIREFVRSSLGIALVPRLSHIEIEGVRSVHLSDVTAQRHVVALHRTDRSSASIIAMCMALKKAAELLSEDLWTDPTPDAE